jgi:hypothetical protein
MRTTLPISAICSLIRSRSCILWWQRCFRSGPGEIDPAIGQTKGALQSGLSYPLGDQLAKRIKLKTVKQNDIRLGFSYGGAERRWFGIR